MLASALVPCLSPRFHRREIAAVLVLDVVPVHHPATVRVLVAADAIAVARRAGHDCWLWGFGLEGAARRRPRTGVMGRSWTNLRWR